MLRLNLLPYRAARRQQQRRRFALMLVMTAAVAAAVVLAVALHQDAVLAREQTRLATQRQHSAALDAQLSTRAALETELTTLQAQQQELAQLTQARLLPAQLLASLAQHVPGALRLVRLSQQGDRLVLEGQVGAQQVLVQFSQALAGEALLLDAPRVLELRQAQQGAGQALAFTVEVKLRAGALDK